MRIPSNLTLPRRQDENCGTSQWQCPIVRLSKVQIACFITFSTISQVSIFLITSTFVYLTLSLMLFNLIFSSIQTQLIISNYIQYRNYLLQHRLQMSNAKPEVSVQSLKEIVKKFKNQGFQSLINHDLAVALSTIGFTQVCRQFGAVWNTKHQKQALKILQNSDYDLSWYGKTNNIRYTNFLTLCSRGDIEKVKQFMATLNSENKKQLYTTVDNFKRNALHVAVKESYDVLAQYLINQGFPLNARDRQLKTPLHYCKNQLICQVLVNKKAKIIVRDNKYCTPVHYASSSGDYKCLQIMIKAANIVNQKDSTGKTPLFYAVYNTSEQQVNIIRILLQNGAKINQQDIFGKTPLHYAAQIGKSRCIPILLRKGASIDARDKHGKTPLDLAQGQQKVRKIMLAYCNNKGTIFEDQQQAKRKQLKQIQQQNILQQTIGTKQKKASKIKDSKINQSSLHHKSHGQSQVYVQNANQISTWVRQKFFVLMKKLQQSGIKAMWHLKRPYVYTGSWAEDIESLEDLYQTFLNINGPQAAMRAFNILCPYQKPLPTVLSKSQEAFHSFFGESWFSNDPVQKLRNMHSSTKIKNQLQLKMKQAQDLKTQLMGYRSQIESLESKIMNLNEQITHYKKVQDQLRKQKSRNTQQYTQNLRLMSQNQQLKTQLNNLIGGQEKTKILSNLVSDLRSKNEGLEKQIEKIKLIQAAARRKCGQVFLKSLSLAQTSQQFKIPSQQNLYDDDAIISLYNLLKNNPPNLQKRFKSVDKRGNNKLTIDQFTQMLQNLSMLPQDVMSMHRITGFAFGRKTLSLQQFKTILQNRHKNRPMWQKKLIRKIKTIILEKGINIQKFFKLIDKNDNGTIEAVQLRKGLEQCNIFMNQSDWSNLFNLLDSDNSGEIDLNQLKTLMEQQKTGKLGEYKNKNEQSQEQEKQVSKQEDQKQNQQNKQQGKQQQDNQNKEETQKEQQQNKQQQEKPQQQQQQQVEPYQQKNSDQQQGVTKLNGTLKIQMPKMKLQKQNEQDPDIVYVKFRISEDIDSDDSVKAVKLTQQTLKIASQFKFIQYKVTDLENLNLNISVWKKRDDADQSQENYLGEVYVNLREAIQQPKKWGISKKLALTAESFQKNVKGKLALQVRWTPQQQE